MYMWYFFFFFFSSRRRHTRYWRDWSSDVCSSDLFRLDPLVASVVLENQRAIVGFQLAQAAFKLLERGFPGLDAGVRAAKRQKLRRGIVRTGRVTQTDVTTFGSAKRPEEHELRRDVTVSCGWFRDHAFFVEPARNPRQRFIGQFIGREAALAIEVRYQPP